MKKLALMCAGLLCLASTAQAGLVQPFGIGARNAALGEAVSANATDAFAVYYNPAGLSNITTPVVTTGITVYDAEVYYKNFKITDANGNNITPAFVENTRWKGDMDPLLNPHMGFAMPINEKISFGIAAYAPYGFHLDTDKDPFKKPMGFNAWESLYTRVAVTPAISYKINERLALGFGVSLGRSTCKAGKTNLTDPFQPAIINQLRAGFQQQGYSDAIIDNVLLKGIKADTSAPGGPFVTSELDMEDDFNWSWNAGIQYRPTDKLSLGLTYRSRANGDFKGDFIHNGQKVGTVTMPYDHPDQVQLGIRYAFTDRFALSFDLVWANWSINAFQHEYITSTELPNGVVSIIDQTATNIANAALAQGQITQAQYSAFQAQQKAGLTQKVSAASIGMTRDMGYKRDWSDEIQYKLGAEFVLNDRLTLLAGYVYDPTPVPAHTFDNGWPDNDRHLMNLGASIKANQNWTIDLAFQHIRTFAWGYRNDIQGTSENLNKTIGYGTTGDPNAKVYVQNQGYLWGYTLTANYRF
ncbi:OmpP1/FadL family transporter [Desulfobotulus sp.]|uniref:OmpP1/FadL family transporter n=1 Tax=Desulfobotulus sp. TaxID=1940337 RepID=UPI002A36231A|nr:outer membrane protein transport protein [Desulfobotulus sp.]MDY0164486.1 outer membrane protein transport protein [Desulfobotulus sp.]